MHALSRKWFKSPDNSMLKTATVWSRGMHALAPNRFLIVLTLVMPAIYTLLFFFGTVATIIPLPIFLNLVGFNYGVAWAGLIAIAALISLIGLVFRLRIEIYSSIVLAVLLLVYPVFIGYAIVTMPTQINIARISSMFSVLIYPIMPAWRSLDIIIEIRKLRKRELIVEASLGGQ